MLLGDTMLQFGINTAEVCTLAVALTSLAFAGCDIGADAVNATSVSPLGTNGFTDNIFPLTTDDTPGRNSSFKRYGDNGTDPDLKEIFIGRCADFKSGKVNPTADPDELRAKNCSYLWQLFSSTFMFREACNVDDEMYERFVEEATITVPMDKATYWDGWDIYSTVKSYANEGKRSWTLECSLVGYLVNGLKFCGQVDPPGIRYDSCPGVDECGFAKGSADAFWARASTYFGKQAKGQVRVFLNSNRDGGAFQLNNSYFTSYELVNMPKEEVQQVNIYLVTDLEQNTGDNCTSPSLESFQNILRKRELPYKCHDQPRDVLHLLCVDGNGSNECRLKYDDESSPNVGAATNLQSTNVWMASAMTIVILISQFGYP